MTNTAPGSGSGTPASVPGPAPVERPWPLALALALFVAAFILVWFRYQPPAPRPASAPAAEFSAARAQAVLVRLLGHQAPHPVGSAADAAVRQALLEEFRRTGYQPEVQPAFACAADGVCAQVENVVARLDVPAGVPAVLLAAHYDSVPAGPGAADDGSGVAAVLEIARALRAGPPPRHSVIFLLDEGEEAGLLGAVGFVQHHPWARDVGAVVNLDARGTSGPSLMFETGEDTRWLIPLFARAMRRPLANSLYYAVYSRLPNDTDFSILKRQALDGFNFAFVGGVARYHTSLDNLAHLDPRSLQSQGEHGLAAVRALADAGLAKPHPPGGVVFFGLAAWRMVWWPLGLTPWLALLALGLVAACVWRAVARRVLTLPALGRGIVVWPVAIILATLLAAGLQAILHVVGSVPSGWVAHPAAMVAAFVALGFLPPLAAALCIGRYGGYWEFWSAAWLWWSVVGVVTAVKLPEGAYLAVIPALAAGIGGLAAISLHSPRAREAAAALPAAIAALLCFEAVWFLYTSLGAPGLVMMGVILATLATTLAPMLAMAPPRLRRSVVTVVAAAAIAATAVAAILPPYSADWPERLKLLHAHSAATGRNSWLAFPESGKLPSALARAAPWTARPVSPFPWEGSTAFRAADSSPHSTAELAGPEFDLVEDVLPGARLHVQGTIWPSAGGRVLAVLLPPPVRVDWFKLQGVLLPPLAARALAGANGWHRFACVTAPKDGLPFEFVAEGPAKIDAVLLQQSYTLPAGAEAIIAARPDYAVPSQSGDATIWTQTVLLGAAGQRELRSPGAK